MTVWLPAGIFVRTIGVTPLYPLSRYTPDRRGGMNGQWPVDGRFGVTAAGTSVTASSSLPPASTNVDSEYGWYPFRLIVRGTGRVAGERIEIKDTTRILVERGESGTGCRQYTRCHPSGFPRSRGCHAQPGLVSGAVAELHRQPGYPMSGRSSGNRSDSRPA